MPRRKKMRFPTGSTPYGVCCLPAKQRVLIPGQTFLGPAAAGAHEWQRQVPPAGAANSPSNQAEGASTTTRGGAQRPQERGASHIQQKVFRSALPFWGAGGGAGAHGYGTAELGVPTSVDYQSVASTTSAECSRVTRSHPCLPQGASRSSPHGRSASREPARGGGWVVRVGEGLAKFCRRQ